MVRTRTPNGQPGPPSCGISQYRLMTAELRALALDLLHDLQEVKLGPGEAIQAVDGGLIPRPELVEHSPKLTAIPFGSGRLLAKDVAVVHARLGQGLKLKRPVIVSCRLPRSSKNCLNLLGTISKKGSKWTYRRSLRSRTRLPSSPLFMATWAHALTRSDDAPLC